MPPQPTNAAPAGDAFARGMAARALKKPITGTTGTFDLPNVAMFPAESAHFSSTAAQPTALIEEPAIALAITASPASLVLRLVERARFFVFRSAVSCRDFASADDMIDTLCISQTGVNIGLMSDVPKDAELLESIRQHGCFLPVYMWEDEVIDGQRRRQCALETARDWDVHLLESKEEAARCLWSLHPERALIRFGSDLGLIKQAELFGARPTEVAAVRDRMRPPPPTYDKTPEHRRQLHIRLDQKSAKIINELKKSTGSNYGQILSAALESADPDLLLVRLEQGRNVKRPRAYPRPLKKSS